MLIIIVSQNLRIQPALNIWFHTVFFSLLLNHNNGIEGRDDPNVVISGIRSQTHSSGCNWLILSNLLFTSVSHKGGLQEEELSSFFQIKWAELHQSRL